MAGKGSEVGGTFEELAAIIDAVWIWTADVGVCLDTCHVWDAGYDIVGDLDGVLDEFDRVIGLDRLHAIHLNDSPERARRAQGPPCRASARGRSASRRSPPSTNNPRLRDLPFYLETPNPELSGFAEEIALLRSAHEG